jgi:hypothetical protein
MTDSRQFSTEPLNVTDIKLRARIKLAAEKEDFIFGPLLYVEYRLQQDRRFPDTWEFRFVMDRDFGGLNVSANLVAEEQINYISGGKAYDLGYSAGASYATPADGLNAGLESTGDFNHNKYSLGPCISYTGSYYWGSAAVLFGLNNDSEYIKVQAVIGLVFDFTKGPGFPLKRAGKE